MSTDEDLPPDSTDPVTALRWITIRLANAPSIRWADACYVWASRRYRDVDHKVEKDFYALCRELGIADD